MDTNPDRAEAPNEIVARRLLDAPRELVFQAFTDPEHVVHWWGPTGFRNTISVMDVRPGGVWRFMMHGPDGTDYPNRVEYTQVEAPALLAWAHFEDNGSPAPTFHAVATFEARGSQTALTLRLVFDSAAARDKTAKDYGAVEGAQQTMERLAQHLPAMRG